MAHNNVHFMQIVLRYLALACCSIAAFFRGKNAETISSIMGFARAVHGGYGSTENLFHCLSRKRANLDSRTHFTWKPREPELLVRVRWDEVGFLIPHYACLIRRWRWK